MLLFPPALELWFVQCQPDPLPHRFTDFGECAQPFHPCDLPRQHQGNLVGAVAGEFLEVAPNGGAASLLGVPVRVPEAQGSGEQADEKDGQRDQALETESLSHANLE